MPYIKISTMSLKIKKETTLIVTVLSKISLHLIRIQKYKVEQCLGDSYLWLRMWKSLDSRPD